jgi:hypothetical protein
MHRLLKTLVDLNVIDEATESFANQYFTLQDNAWPDPATPTVTGPIYVDGAAS